MEKNKHVKDLRYYQIRDESFSEGYSLRQEEVQPMIKRLNIFIKVLIFIIFLLCLYITFR